jgi:hypothetical protein
VDLCFIGPRRLNCIEPSCSDTQLFISTSYMYSILVRYFQSLSVPFNSRATCDPASFFSHPLTGHRRNPLHQVLNTQSFKIRFFSPYIYHEFNLNLPLLYSQPSKKILPYCTVNQVKSQMKIDMILCCLIKELHASEKVIYEN